MQRACRLDLSGSFLHLARRVVALLCWFVETAKERYAIYDLELHLRWSVLLGYSPDLTEVGYSKTKTGGALCAVAAGVDRGRNHSATKSWKKWIFLHCCGRATFWPERGSLPKAGEPPLQRVGRDRGL